jgi:hypothetical protein
MITSIFSKSKPINFIIVFFVTLLTFIVANLKQIEEPINMAFILKQMALFFVCFISILVLNFIVEKNNLTQKNNYETLLLSLFLLTISQVVSNENILYANFFVLLGLRRIISLRTQTNVKKKLFDAAFWITIASFFFFWAILFLLLIFITLLFYTNNKVRHWLIPFVGMATVLLIAVCISVILNNTFLGIFDSFKGVSYDFSSYNSPQFIIAITMLFSFGIWASIFFIKNIKHKKKALRPSFKTILITVIIAFVIIVLAPKKNGSEFLFLLAPLAIIITNYIETIQDKWFKELFLFVIIALPFVLLLL